MKIGIVGCAGRMGKALIEEVHFNTTTELAGGVVRSSSEFAGLDLGTIAGLDPIGMNASSHIKDLFDQSDAVIEFSNPVTALQSARIAAETKTPMVSGTTGFSVDQMAELKDHAASTPIIWSSNMSIGVNLLFALTEQVSRMLDENFDIEIVEMHHCRKVDAPSGTALSLGEAAARGRGVALEEVATKSREGVIGPRKSGEIGFSTIRGGDVIGDHHVIFAGDGERIELAHKASSRKIYAKGAVRAALWSTSQQQGGLYTMQDVLGPRDRD